MTRSGVALHPTHGWHHSWELTQPLCEYPLKWAITSCWWDQGSLYIPQRESTTPENSPNLCVSIRPSEPAPHGDEIRGCSTSHTSRLSWYNFTPRRKYREHGAVRIDLIVGVCLIHKNNFDQFFDLTNVMLNDIDIGFSWQLVKFYHADQSWIVVTTDSHVVSKLQQSNFRSFMEKISGNRGCAKIRVWVTFATFTVY